jgi:protein-L-isoaspartate(D-aspartate) O-methyltransferase
MVEEQIVARGIDNTVVVSAMRAVPRHEFVPSESQHLAYGDHPLSIGFEQTISQPYIVALMTDLAGVSKSSRVLEIGTGSGYQAAVLAEVSGEVYSIEIVEPLSKRADATLTRLGYKVTVRAGDGYQGWPDKAPFDAILLTAAPPKIPQPLIDQLAEGGTLVAPVGVHTQDLLVLTKRDGKIEKRVEGAVRFVPMTGKAQQQ